MPYIQIEDISLPFKLRRSLRAKRMHVAFRQHFFEVVAPKRISNHEALKFLFTQRFWMHKIYSKRAALKIDNPFCWPSEWNSGQTVPFRARRMELKIEDGKKWVRLEETQLIVSLPHASAEHSLTVITVDLLYQWYQQQTLALVERAVSYFSEKLKRRPTSFHVKQQKTRWGSCGIDNKIYLNWLLILAPVGVLEYVVAHELCHLFYRNHGPRFWGKVAELIPNYLIYEKWLKQNGFLLQPLPRQLA